MGLSTTSIPVLVWGGGSGGVAAALQAARSGAPTLLLTPGPWLGGMLSAAGVCCPDGNELTPWQTGLWGALLRALARAEPTGLDHNWVSCFGFRPATAETLLRQWVEAEPLLHWIPDCTLRDVQCQDGLIRRISVEHGGAHVIYSPQLVIDGSDLGDLLALGAGEYRLGWESQDQWGEPSAPPAARLSNEAFFARQPVQSPTWVVIAQLDPDAEPSATSSSDLPPPFEGATSTFGLGRTVTYGRLPGGLVMLNWPLNGNDWHGDLPGLFAADGAARRDHLQSLAPQMQAHSMAFLSALQDAGAPLQPAAVFPQQGSCDGALQGPSPLALMPYWREGRRLKGQTTVLETDLLPLAPGASRAALPLDDGACSSIAVGNYANDHHYPGGDWPLAPKSCRWGGRWTGTPFCIPYRALLSAGTGNLLAADKCLSVSHMANGATRLQPLVLNIGQAAGLAAALSWRQGCHPWQLPVGVLQQALITDPLAPAAPFPLWDTPWHHPQWRQRQLLCLQSPELLGPDGRLSVGASVAGCDQPGHQPPAEPHEQGFEGEFTGDPDQGYRLTVGERSWPVITLEPAMHQALQDLRQGQRIGVIGCANPWGPWLRISRFSDVP